MLLKKIYEQFQHKISDAQMCEKVCLVCDRLRIITEINELTMAKLPLIRMKNRLTPSNDMPYNLIRQYDLSDLIPEFYNMMLSSAGLQYDIDQIIYIICNACLNSLKRGDYNFIN